MPKKSFKIEHAKQIEPISALIVLGMGIAGLSTEKKPPRREAMFVNLSSKRNAKSIPKASFLPVKSYHVSCQSDRIEPRSDSFFSLAYWYSFFDYVHPAYDMGGVVLYAYDDRTDWRLNGVHCKTGYIILKKSSNIEHIKSRIGAIHGKVYKSVFGRDPDERVIGAGFSYSYKEGKWKFNSSSFNDSESKYHTVSKKNTYAREVLEKDKYEARTMNSLEQKMVLEAIQHWFDTGEQNYYPKEPVGIVYNV